MDDNYFSVKQKYMKLSIKNAYMDSFSSFIHNYQTLGKSKCLSTGKWLTPCYTATPCYDTLNTEGTKNRLQQCG